MGKKTIKILIWLALLFGLWVYVQYHNNSIERKINENKYETIAKVYKIKYGAKNRSLEYKFIYKGKLYESSEPINGSEYVNSVNKYFVLHLSSKNPKYHRIFLDREVTNPNVIRNSGL